MSAVSVEYVGPFNYHAVIVDGWRVPYLTAEPANGGRVFLSLDDRFALELTVADAERVVPFIANCIAVAAGYTCHPGDGIHEPLRRTPFARFNALYSE